MPPPKIKNKKWLGRFFWGGNAPPIMGPFKVFENYQKKPFKVPENLKILEKIGVFLPKKINGFKKAPFPWGPQNLKVKPKIGGKIQKAPEKGQKKRFC